jgi:hypothetical protein
MEVLQFVLRMLGITAFVLLIFGCVVKACLMFSVSARTQRLFPAFWAGLGEPSVLRVLWSPKSPQHVRWWDWATRRPVEPGGDPTIAAMLSWLTRIQSTLLPLFLAAFLFAAALRWLR